MAKVELHRFSKSDAGMFIVGLITPKLIKYVRAKRAVKLHNPLTLFNKFKSVSGLVEDFFNLPENAAVKKALNSTFYMNNYDMLAKKIVHHV